MQDKAAALEGDEQRRRLVLRQADAGAVDRRDRDDGPFTSPTAKAPTTAEGAVAKRPRTSIRTERGAGGSAVDGGGDRQQRQAHQGRHRHEEAVVRMSPSAMPSGESIRATFVQTM